MDAKRLEELVVWAKAQEEALVANDIADVAGYYADLARCAAAWAKVECARRKGRGKWRFDLVYGCSTLSCGYNVGHPTAIAAVESAPEVTDAK